MVDPGEDFGAYMDNLAAREEWERERQEMHDRHEVKFVLPAIAWFFV